MPLGPVFDVELVTTARRARYYALRFAYGSILLGCIVARYRQIGWDVDRSFQPSPATMSAFAAGLLLILNGVQEIAVLVMTPALVAGVIADERQRRTLPHLLATGLSSAEIVLGKLAARLLHAMVFLAAGLPVLGLLSLFGGIDPRQVAFSFAGAASTAFFAAGLSIFVSAITRRAREALVMAYAFELAWLFLPMVLDSLVSGWDGAYRVFRPVNDWLMASSPDAMVGLGRAFGDDQVPRLAWMVGLQAAYGSMFVGLAIWRLRPGDRVGPAGPSASPGRGREARPDRRIGDDPMLWKECLLDRQGGPTRAAWSGLVVMALASLAYLVAGSAWPAFEEVARHGYGEGPAPNRGELNTLIGLATMAVGFAWSIAVATSAAGSVLTEREDDTWISLVGTPMGGREILRAKRIGAFLRPRALILALATLWVVGLAAGSIHPIAFAALAAEFVAVGAFSAALGAYFSLRLRTTAKALAATLAVILALDIGGPICAYLASPDGELAYGGLCAPYLLAKTCADHPTIRQVLGWAAGSRNLGTAREAGSCLVGVLAYALGAGLLTLAADRSFDRVVGRPRRPARVPSD